MRSRATINEWSHPQKNALLFVKRAPSLWWAHCARWRPARPTAGFLSIAIAAHHLCIRNAVRESTNLRVYRSSGRVRRPTVSRASKRAVNYRPAKRRPPCNETTAKNLHRPLGELAFVLSRKRSPTLLSLDKLGWLSGASESLKTL